MVCDPHDPAWSIPPPRYSWSGRGESSQGWSRSVDKIGVAPLVAGKVHSGALGLSLAAWVDRAPRGCAGPIAGRSWSGSWRDTPSTRPKPHHCLDCRRQEDLSTALMRLYPPDGAHSE
ncbi:hypothetical protein FQA39_LY19252 [Lamprigera yunnana]|nr:hypothetical protein FQA39_LY19252 [Lamprigera yunnana]